MKRNCLSSGRSRSLYLFIRWVTKRIVAVAESGTYRFVILTPWSRVLLEKVTGFAANQELPAFYGTRKFVTVLTSDRHLSLSRANSIQSPQPLPTSWRFLILSSHLRLGLPSGLFPSGLPTKTLCTPLPPYVPHVPPISFFSILPPAQCWVRSREN